MTLTYQDGIKDGVKLAITLREFFINHPEYINYNYSKRRR